MNRCPVIHEELESYLRYNADQLGDMVLTGMYWYVGCMHMARVLADKRYDTESALAGGMQFDTQHMQNLGAHLVGKNEVNYENWLRIEPPVTATL